MEDDEALNLERRRRIYHFVRTHPGLHLRALEDRLEDISLGDLRYHLDYLEKRDLVTSTSDGYRRTYFSARDVFLQDRTLLALLRQKSPRRIVLHLLTREEASFDDLREVLGVSKSTLSFHLKKLTEKNLVRVRKEEGKNAYFLEDKENVAELLIAYRSSFVDQAVDRVLEAWLP